MIKIFLLFFYYGYLLKKKQLDNLKIIIKKFRTFASPVRLKTYNISEWPRTRDFDLSLLSHSRSSINVASFYLGWIFASNNINEEIKKLNLTKRQIKRLLKNAKRNEAAAIIIKQLRLTETVYKYLTEIFSKSEIANWLLIRNELFSDIDLKKIKDKKLKLEIAPYIAKKLNIKKKKTKII